MEYRPIRVYEQFKKVLEWSYRLKDRLSVCMLYVCMYVCVRKCFGTLPFTTTRTFGERSVSAYASIIQVNKTQNFASSPHPPPPQKTTRSKSFNYLLTRVGLHILMINGLGSILGYLSCRRCIVVIQNLG